MNYKKILTLSVLILNLFILNSCSNEEQKVVKKDKVPRYIQKDIEQSSIFDLSKDTATVSFSKTTEAQSETIVTVAPQTAGTIKTINVDIGDTVKKGDILATLGDSLSTDISAIQLNTAIESERLTKLLQNLSIDSNDETLRTAEISAKQSFETYKNSATSINNANETYDLQLDSAQNAEDNANKAYKKAKNNYSDALDALDIAENTGDFSLIAQAQAQVTATKAARDGAKLGVEQAESAIDLLEAGHNTQQDSLNFALNSSYNQYQIALNQLNTAVNGIEQKNIGSESQVLQVESARKIAETNKKYLTISSPINGIITKINSDIGSSASPGQAILTIESTDKVILKTSLNENELALVSQYDSVDIIGSQNTIKGYISKISPTINQSTKKIDIEIEVPQNSGIPSGILMKVNFKLSKPEKLFIPINSIFINNNEKTVKLLSDTGFVEYKIVKVGEIIGDNIEILDGLDGNEKLITSTTSFLYEGDYVVLNQ